MPSHSTQRHHFTTRVEMEVMGVKEDMVMAAEWSTRNTARPPMTNNVPIPIKTYAFLFMNRNVFLTPKNNALMFLRYTVSTKRKRFVE